MMGGRVTSTQYQRRDYAYIAGQTKLRISLLTRVGVMSITIESRTSGIHSFPPLVRSSK
jgi:hypothetical protein